MADKSKGGRETKKPKASQNIKAKGQTPGPVEAINPAKKPKP